MTAWSIDAPKQIQPMPVSGLEESVKVGSSGSASETPSRFAGSSTRRVRSQWRMLAQVVAGCRRITSFRTSRETRVPKLRGERIREPSTVPSAQAEALPGSFLAFTLQKDTSCVFSWLRTSMWVCPCLSVHAPIFGPTCTFFHSAALFLKLDTYMAFIAENPLYGTCKIVGSCTLTPTS